MSTIRLEAVSKSFGGFVAVRRLDLEIGDGEFVAILGPSGCGKTTTMNMIAGLEAPSAGRVLFDGADVTGLPAERRGIGFVFQNYAIFSHLSVRENLAFGLRVRRRPEAEIRSRVEAMAGFMNLAHRLEAPSAGLSVNELQKLAIGRSAIVEPRIFLLDEPLSNLDAAFRERMRADLRRIQRELGQTMVYVTHDQIEAMGLADRIAVMSQGEVQQFDTPAAIYARPVSVYVAEFIGAPAMNVVRARVARGGDAGARACLGGLAELAVETPRGWAAREGEEVLVGFRPEALELTEASRPGAIGADVAFVETVGRRRIAHFAAGPVRFRGVFDRTAPVRAGMLAHIRVDPGAMRLFDPRTERAIELAAA